MHILDKNLVFFSSNIEKEGPFSPSLSSSCIDKVGTNDQRCIMEFIIGDACIMVQLNGDDVALLKNALGDIQKLMSVL